MYGIPLPLPGIVNFSKEDSIAYLSDTLNTISPEYMLIKDIEESIHNGLTNNDDITSKMGLTRQTQREAYDALSVFLAKPEYVPNKVCSLLLFFIVIIITIVLSLHNYHHDNNTIIIIITIIIINIIIIITIIIIK